MTKREYFRYWLVFCIAESARFKVIASKIDRWSLNEPFWPMTKVIILFVLNVCMIGQNIIRIFPFNILVQYGFPENQKRLSGPFLTLANKLLLWLNPIFFFRNKPEYLIYETTKFYCNNVLVTLNRTQLNKKINDCCFRLHIRFLAQSALYLTLVKPQLN